MFCEKCGSSVADGERFCGNCGAPVNIAPSEPVTAAADQPQGFAPQFSDQQQGFAPQFSDQQQGFVPQFGEPAAKPKMSKKKKTILIASIAGGAVLIAGIIVLIIFLTRKPSMAELEKNFIHDALEPMRGGSIIEDASYTVDLEPGQYLIDLAENQGVDISWLKNTQLKISSDTGDRSGAFKADLTVNGVGIATLSALLDTETGQMLLDLGDLADGVGMTHLDTMGSIDLAALAKIDRTQLVELIEKYYGYAFESVEKVDETKGVFEANGVEEKCRVLTADLSQKESIHILCEILKKAKDDDDLKDLVIQLYNAGLYSSYGYGSSEDFYKDFRSGLDRIIESYSAYEKEASGEKAVTLIDYAVKKKIIGRTIKVYNYGSTFEVTFGNAHQGDKFGSIVKVNGVVYARGSGTYKDGVINGDLKIYSDDTELGTVTFNDYNYGENKGGVEISLTNAAWKMITHGSSDSATYALLTLSADFSDGKTVVDVMLGKERVLKATIKKSAKESIAFNADRSAKDMEEWTQTIDFEELTKRLKSAGMPEELIGMLMQSVPVGGSSDSYSDSDYYDYY